MPLEKLILYVTNTINYKIYYIFVVVENKHKFVLITQSTGNTLIKT